MKKNLPIIQIHGKGAVGRTFFIVLIFVIFLGTRLHETAVEVDSISEQSDRSGNYVPPLCSGVYCIVVIFFA